jgi:hypothetical protein
LELACRGIDHEAVSCQLIADGRFGLILPGCDRQQTVSLGRQLLASTSRVLGASRFAGTKVSLGIAATPLPPPNFRAQELIEVAERCLSAAHSFGGNCLKSIEV